MCFQDNKYIDCNCVMSIDLTLGLNTVLFVGYFISGIYLDNIYPNENGVYRPLWYIFMPSYWSPKVEARAAIEQLGRNPPAPVDEYGSADDDVKEEENRLRERLNDLTNGADIVHGKTAIELFALRKVFGSRAGTGPFVAVQGSWFQIERGSLFCLLGPNGAGKTTTINMLTGVLPPSAGEALIYGESLSSSGGIDRIRGMMGVCPQFGAFLKHPRPERRHPKWTRLACAFSLGLQIHLARILYLSSHASCSSFTPHTLLHCTFPARCPLGPHDG